MRKFVWSVLLAVLLGLVTFGGPAHGQFTPPPPPPPPGATATPMPTPTATPTAIPLTLQERLASATLAPLTRQKVTILTAPGASLLITVRFPNGNTRRRAGTADASGRLTWSYVQPGSRITHRSRTAKVSVRASNGGGTKTSTKRYTIAFAALDVSAEPRTQQQSRFVAIWVHTRPGTPVTITLRNRLTYHRVTQGDGWTAVQVLASPAVGKGRVLVVARALVGGRPVSGETSFQVS